MPLLSVIIPTFNRAHLIADTVNSALNQADFSDFEVIVVDDGSTDQTPNILDGFGRRIKVVRRENKGLGASRNLGIANASGEYAALLDDDDLWFPWTLSTYAEAIRQYRRPWLISSGYVEFQDPLELKSVAPSPNRFRYFQDFYQSHRTGHWVTPSGALFRIEDFRSLGGFFEFNYGQEENDLWLRGGNRSGFVIIDQPICFGRRVHALNISSFSNRNLLGTRYILDQEKKRAYPAERGRRMQRLGILTSHVRGVSLACVRDKRFGEGWNLYFRTLKWHLQLGRWRYLLGFPMIALMNFARRARRTGDRSAPVTAERVA
jgi:glycosyltransferase involved in cell wall biosynthesis